VIEPYYADHAVSLYLGDMRELLPALDLTVDAVVADPPYGETRIHWDRWPEGWPSTIASTSRSMWCFGSLRTFGAHFAEFLAAGWNYSQDVVWEKHNGSGFAADRFRRVHEHATHWYQGAWRDIYHQVPIVEHEGPYRGTRTAARAGSAHLGHSNGHNQPWQDNGTRLMRSVIWARSMKGRAIHPTEKPVAILMPLIEYACPIGGLVLDPFAGSCSTGVAARLTGRRAVLIEADEQMCEKAVQERLQSKLEESHV
jgi:site-specific DNA-methyltransferase (adenine-specific)